MGTVVDVVIVGGGAAGLSAALVLSRARRSVVVIDAGEPRNAPASHMQGFLTRDGMPPTEFLARAREEVRGYGAEVVDGRALGAVLDPDGAFAVELADGRIMRGRRLLVTTGLVDELPDIGGVAERWGRDVLHCPYCHGWEVRDRAIVIIATGPTSVHQAMLFRQLSPNVTIVLHSGLQPTMVERERLSSRSVRIVDGPVDGLVVEDDRVTGVRLEGGEVIGADAVVVAPRFVARSGVLASLGIEPVEHSIGIGTYIPADGSGATAVPGVWVAGNVTDLMAQVLHAAAAGSTAAARINADLVDSDFTVALAATTPVMDEAFWDERYRSAPMVWSGNPNPHLVSDLADLAPGTALDVGAGEGADAIWLAQRGWRVTAVDISAVALERGRAQAEAVGAEGITWVQADLIEWEPPAGAFDLVSAHFMHLPSAERGQVYQRCIDAVAPGGLLLIVGHHPSDMETTAHRPRIPDLFFTAEEIAATLGEGWTVLATDTRPRSDTGHDDHDGNTITISDAVLLARRSS